MRTCGNQTARAWVTIHSPRRGEEKKPLKTTRGFFAPPFQGGLNGYTTHAVGYGLQFCVPKMI